MFFNPLQRFNILLLVCFLKVLTYYRQSPLKCQRNKAKKQKNGHKYKTTIEHGHGNHLANEMSSVAYWYSFEPGKAKNPPPLAERRPVFRDNAGNWLYDKSNQCPGKQIELNSEMKKMKAKWKKEYEK